MQHFNSSLFTKSLYIASLTLYTSMTQAEIIQPTTVISAESSQNTTNTQISSTTPTVEMSKAAITNLATTAVTPHHPKFPHYSTELQQFLTQKKSQASVNVVLYSQPAQQKQLLAWLSKKKIKIQSQTPEYIFVALTPQQLADPTLAKHRALKSADVQSQLSVPEVKTETASIATPATVSSPSDPTTTPPTVTPLSAPATATPVQTCAKEIKTSTEKCIATELEASGEVISQPAMSLAILDTLSKKDKNHNLIFSPQSLAETGLTLLLASSKPSQLTRPTWFLPQFQNPSQFKNLHLAAHSQSYQSWNQTWYNQQAKIQPNFIEYYQRILQGSVQTIDFSHSQQAADTINQDIATKTKQHITQLLDATDVQNAQVVLTNAAYFKAQWQMPFESYKTSLQPFKNADQKTVQVATMNNTLTLASANAQDWTMVDLPFHDGQTTVSLLLPPEKKPLALPSTQVLHQLDQTKTQQKLEIALPKIKLTGNKINLAQLFPKISSWQLDQLLQDDQVKQLKGLHQATIEWDEQGAEATAATAVIGKRSLAANTPKISFDRPFVFLVRDQKQVLFSGVVRQLETVKTMNKVENPTVETNEAEKTVVEAGKVEQTVTTMTETPETPPSTPIEDHSHH